MSNNYREPMLGSEEEQYDLSPTGSDFNIDLSLGADERDPDESLEAALMAHDRRNGAKSSQPATVTGDLVDASENLPVAADDSKLRHGVIFGEAELDLAQEFGINLQQEGTELIQEAALDISKSATLLVTAGLRLMAAKEKCEHGEFKEHCQKIGIVESRASETIRYAKFASQLDPKERGNYLVLPKKSALLLANADPVVVEFLLEDENLELARKIRKKSDLLDLSRELVETTDERDKLQKELTALQEENKALKSINETQVAGSEYPAFVVQLRKESSVLADEAIAALSSIRTHAETFDEKIVQSDLPHKDMTRMMEAAMFPALGNIASVLHAANKLLIDVCRDYELNYEDIAGRIHTLPDHELQIIEAARDTMLNRKTGKAAARQGQYVEQGEVTRGRGRPKKV